MKTDDLVAALARSGAPVAPSRAGRRLARALSCGALLSALAMLVFLGPRSDLPKAIVVPMFWVKLAFPAAIAAAAVAALRRLGSPGMRLGWGAVGVVLPVAVVWLLAGTALVEAPSGRRLTLILGSSSWVCPFLIATLSLPGLACALAAMRQLAPTRLALAGMFAGVYAGAAAGFFYAIHCVEMQAPFIAVWYVLGISIPAAAGAVLGRRLLHW